MIGLIAGAGGLRNRGELNLGAEQRADRGAGLAVVLLALGAAWSVGNVGAVVDELGRDFEISLATVGLFRIAVLR